MTSYRPCAGCKFQKTDCAERTRVRQMIAGMCVTIISWKCSVREPLFRIGQKVIVTTADQYHGDEGDVMITEFPAHVVRHAGSRTVVYIKPGSESVDGDTTFETPNRGFCKIPNDRIMATNEPDEAICRSCEMPACYGHAEGYSCDPAFAKYLKKIAEAI